MFNKLISFFVMYLIIMTSVIADNSICQTGLNNMMAVFTPNEYTCSNGEFLPAYSVTCESCPDDYTCAGGTYNFNDDEFQGAEKSSTYITHDMTNMCSTNAYHELVAVFTPNTHNCSAGTYLPANVDECTTCPPNHYCLGGTYTFNETTASGATPCPNNQTSIAGASSVDDCKTVNLNWISNGTTYQTSTCTLNGLISLPEPPTRPGYRFKGWKLVTNE